MDKKRNLNIYKGSRRDIKINSDIYLVRNVKDHSSDEQFKNLIPKISSEQSIIEDTVETLQKGTETVTTESTIIKDDEPSIASMINGNDKKDSAKDEVKLFKDLESIIYSEMTSGKKKKVLNKKTKPKTTTNELEIYDETLEEFKSYELCSTIGQTQNERDALDSSSLFSQSEKKMLRINSYTPVLVDTILLEKLARLDKNLAKKLILKVFKQLDEINLPNEEIVNNFGSYPDGRPEPNEDIDFFAIIKTKDKKTHKKMSIKKFLINQIYHLILSRLMRNKERPAEILYYLILKLATKKNAIENEINSDVKRVKEKIKEYAEDRKKQLKKIAKQRKKHSEDDLIGKKKKKKGVKKKSKKGTEDGVKRTESVIMNNRRTALAQKLLKAHKGIVVDDKEKKEKQIKEYLIKHARLNTPFLSDVVETSSSDLS